VKPDSWRTAWKWSAIFNTSAIAFDAGTPVNNGRLETNGLFRNSKRQFGTGQLVTVAGMAIGADVAEWLIVKKWPRSARVFTLANFGIGTAHLWTGSHNLILR